jgi:poly(hydroxyalkanoate) depolymerase family esterase
MVRRAGMALLAAALGLPFGAVPTATASAATFTCTAGAWPSATAPAPLLTEPGSVWHCSYTTPADGLSRTAWLYQPQGWSPATSGPLVVMLHGCTEQGPDIAYLTHFDAEAERYGFRVLYPNQAPYTQPANTPTTFDGNGSQCWNWFLPQGQQRDTGEPALIAGLTRDAAAQFATDRRRIDVIGVSAGGATADIMAATYPDLYAAAGVVAGCEYRGLPCLGSASAVPPSLSAQLAYQASCPQPATCAARVVPFIVENGDADTVVPVANAFEVVQQLQLYDAFAQAGQTDLATVPSAPCAVHPLVMPAQLVEPPQVNSAYDVYDYSLDGSPCSVGSDDILGELYIVHGEFHAWPGGAPLYVDPSANQYEIYTNPGGPDLTDIAYQFFVRHPCKVSHGVCAAAPAPAQRAAAASAPRAQGAIALLDQRGDAVGSPRAAARWSIRSS